MSLQTVVTNVVPVPLASGMPDVDAAFLHKGAQAAVFKPRFGQAHQQYFTPKWLCEANADIAEKLFAVPVINDQRGGYPLRVVDLTCGSGRLLAPFAQRGHQVLGIELDERLTPVAKRAVGQHGIIRQGDICAYAPTLPDKSFDVAVINPPYGLWWPATGPLADYTLASTGEGYDGNIESQNMVLELATRVLTEEYYSGGLLIAVLSGKFWSVYPQASDFIKQHYQVIAALNLPKLFKGDYNIDVDAALLVAFRVDPQIRDKKPAPLTGTFEGDNAEELSRQVVDAYVQHLSRRYAWQTDINFLNKRNYDRCLPTVPELDMAVQVDTDSLPVRLTTKGAQPHGDWSGVWAKFYNNTPLETYNRAEGTNSDVLQAFTSLPNVLMAGTDTTITRLQGLGFTVATSEHDAAAIAHAAKRYQRDRLPVRELAPMEFLAWFEDGRITAKASVNLPVGDGTTSVEIVEGATYDLQVRWERNAEQAGEAEQIGKGRDAFTLRHHIDRGYLVFHFTDAEGNRFRVREVDAEQVQAMIAAFGLPEVPTVDDLPLAERKSWAVQLHRLIEQQAAKNGGLRPYPVQQQDILRMATKSRAALLYEMGGGKTMASAYWATLRGYQRVLIVTPASVVPGIIEDLTKWGFNVHPRQLDHGEVSRLRQHKGDKPEETTFWIASYESMGLQDGHYDAWSHAVYDRDGNYQGEHDGNHGAECSAPGCKVKRGQIVRVCPKCGAKGDDFRSTRGSNGGGPRVCRACGYVAWTAGTFSPATDESAGIQGRRMTPLGPRIKRLFSCVILDEVQDAKSKGSLKGETTRALKARGKAVLSGTWLKGYVTDLFWSAGWLLDFGSPLWPFPYNGGSARFLEQFGTFEFVTKEFMHTLQTGKRKLIPSVSNLGRMWRLLSPFAVRRLKEDFLKDLPAKHRDVHWVGLTPEHASIYRRVEEAMQDTLKRELDKEDPNMGVISMALWWGRYASSCPTEEGAPHFAGAFGSRINVDEATPQEIKAVVDALKLQRAVLPKNVGFNKVDTAMDLIRDIHAKGEKVIVFTSLRGLYGVLEATLKQARIGYTGMDGVPTQKRNGVAREFEASGNTVLLAGTGTLNRGVTINGANHVIILNTEWSPETTLQAEDRCHRPGQTKEVYIHYILSFNTMEEQMWELLNQKAAAQRAVFDKEALYKSVEEVMSEAVSAQMRVAKAVIEIERELLPVVEAAPAAVSVQPETIALQPAILTPQPATHNPQPKSPNLTSIGAAQLTLTALFQKLGTQGKGQRPRKAVTLPEQQMSLFDLLAQPASAN